MLKFVLFCYVMSQLLFRQTGPKDEKVVEKSLTEKQILVSSELLENLSAEGDEVVSNNCLSKYLGFDKFLHYILTVYY